ncbi:NucA/NucB deoxyribonuclease domain-containing protein [Paenibacillus sp. HW567]|uniref:NucA/NucB deoxyribonuclease domain-containing protein n=1 Tax=Paenibacillus sp. HW567 TaxID=1034769 RepID=UPI00035C252C|nr:NucA/NucB deoxyribonuclease domain-containing protein [Paenibacillus sp. HW567]
MKAQKVIPSLIIAALLLAATYWFEEKGPSPAGQPSTGSSDVVQLDFPSNRYPETAKHIQDAIRSGESPVCTIDRKEAEENRKESLKGVPTKKGYDRDEWPMAMCEEGGTGADIEYITPSDNRGAGSWVGNQLEELPDGTRVEFMFK